ncbi:MAG: SDR family oxidoreductase [Halieaceae bacterium]|nr:SDR family oxidoreductase [Halieaceae bacterium]
MSDSLVALVTAGASGIGKAITETLLANNYRVHIADINKSALSQLQTEHNTLTGTAADLGKASDAERVYEDCMKAHGRIDVLVNNVGIAGNTARVENADLSDWDTTIAVSLSSCFYMTRLCSPQIQQNKGSIINMASNAALFGFPMRSAYTAAKWALIGLTKTWAMEMGPMSVRVNAVCPGSVSGPRIDGVIERDARERNMTADAIREVYQRQSSMRVFVDAEDIANTVLFLCSESARYISGQAIAVDGHTEGLSNWLEP